MGNVGRLWESLLFFFSYQWGFGLQSHYSLLDTRTMIDELFPTEGSFAEEVVEGNDLTNKIAIFDVEGAILDTGEQTSILSGASTYNHRSFLDKLDMAAKDKNIKGVILRINSPGGGVLESAEVYDKIL